LFKADKDACKKQLIDPEIIDNMLQLLGLNCFRLQRYRKVIWDGLEAEFKDLPTTDRDQALLKLAEKHLTPKDGHLPPYVTTRFLFLMAYLTSTKLLDITKW
jgi:hypothetical protein